VYKCNTLLQKEAAVRIADKNDIFAAAKLGDCTLIMNHVICNPASVHKKDNRYLDWLGFRV